MRVDVVRYKIQIQIQNIHGARIGAADIAPNIAGVIAIAKALKVNTTIMTLNLSCRSETRGSNTLRGSCAAADHNPHTNSRAQSMLLLYGTRATSRYWYDGRCCDCGGAEREHFGHESDVPACLCRGTATSRGQIDQ